MNVDPALIEKITKLVLSELKERQAYPPLTEEEIKRWNEISSSINRANAAPPSLENAAEFVPLTEDEIKRWNEITSFLNRSSNGNDFLQGQVRFHRTYN